MATKSFGILDLSKPDQAKTWLMAFGALARSKRWTDTDAIEATADAPGVPAVYSITDNFMATCGLEALNKIQFIVAPHKVQEMKFRDIEEALGSYLKPKEKLTIAERTHFYGTKQKDNESVMDFIVRLRKAVEFCDFDKLKTSNDPTEEMVLVALVAGLHCTYQKEKVLEKMQSVEMTVSQVQDFVLRLEQVKGFVMGTTVQESVQGSPSSELSMNTITEDAAEEVHFQRKQYGNTENYAKSKMIKNCKFCGRSHPIGHCPAYGKSCSSCGKANHFAAVCKSKGKSVHAVSEQELQEDILHVSGNSEKTKPVIINGHTIPMQIDTGSSISLLSSNIWQQLGRPMLHKCDRQLEAYDGHTMPTMGKFTASLELDDRYSLFDFVVVDANKSFGLIGRDLLNIEQVHSTAMSLNSTFLPVMKGVIASMDLVEGAKNVFCRARPVPIALEADVAQELSRLEAMGIITPIKGAP